MPHAAVAVDLDHGARLAAGQAGLGNAQDDPIGAREGVLARHGSSRSGCHKEENAKTQHLLFKRGKEPEFTPCECPTACGADSCLPDRDRSRATE